MSKQDKMGKEEMREKLLKYYSVKVIVDHFFPEFDRKKFLKELSDYQKSRLERLLNPNKKLFEAYLKEETLPYEGWNHYKQALDRAIRFNSFTLSQLFQKIETAKSKKRKQAKAQRTVVVNDDDLLTKGVLLFLLYEVLKGANAGDTAESENTAKSKDAIESKSPESMRGEDSGKEDTEGKDEKVEELPNRDNRPEQHDSNESNNLGDSDYPNSLDNQDSGSSDFKRDSWDNWDSSRNWNSLDNGNSWDSESGWDDWGSGSDW